MDINKDISMFISRLRPPGQELKNLHQEKVLREKCEEFQTVLFETMMSSMRNTVPKDGLLSGGFAEDVYTSMLDKEYAEAMSKATGSSIADQLFEQLSRKTQER